VRSEATRGAPLGDINEPGEGKRANGSANENV